MSSWGFRWGKGRKAKELAPEPEIYEEREHVKDLYPGARLIAKSLREDTDNWVIDDCYTMTHEPSGLMLWISNGKDHLAERKAKPGLAARNMDFAKEEQEIIWPAVEDARREIDRRDRTENLRPLPKARISKNTNPDGWTCRDAQKRLRWVGFGATPQSAYAAWESSISRKKRDQLPKDILLGVFIAEEG